MSLSTWVVDIYRSPHNRHSSAAFKTFKTFIFSVQPLRPIFLLKKTFKTFIESTCIFWVMGFVVPLKPKFVMKGSVEYCAVR